MISENLKKRIITSILLFFLLILIINYKPIFLYSLIVIGIFSIIEFNDLIKKIVKNINIKLIFNVTFIIYLFIYCSVFFLLTNLIQFKIILFSLLLSCIASDIGGYIFGKTFKGPKISKISPNKTYSGSLGSIVFCCIIFTGLIYLLTQNYNIILILTGLIVSVTCQLGDLFFSYLKRKAKKKDTGNFLPGHGGFLDRIDGILFGVPIGFIFLLLFLT
tara:strand:- start:204 stop:857 length:654 start_codon:yes stop_codon:yes gene_type:complete